MNFIDLRNTCRFFAQNYVLKAFTSFSLIQVIGAIASLFILSIFTRFFAPEDFAKITFIMIIVVILATIADSGLNTAFSIRFYKVSDFENRKNIYSCLIYYPFVLAAFYSIFFLFPGLSEKFFKVEMTISQRFYIYLLILTTACGKFFTNFLMISKKPRLFFITNIFFYLTIIAVGWILVQFIKTGYFAYVHAYLSGYGFLTIAGGFYFLKLYKPRNFPFSAENLKSLLKLGLPLVPNSLLLMLLTYADRYILGMFTGLAAVGIYSAGYLFAEKINTIIINPLGQALTPVAFETFAKSVSDYKQLLKKIFECYWLSMGVFLIAYFSVLRELFILVVGNKYIAGYNIVAIVFAGTIFFGAANMLGGTIVLKEKTDKVFLFSLISVFSNILLNFILIPEFGIYGAALATFLSYIIYFALFFHYTQKLLYVPYNFRLIISSGLISLFFLLIIVGLSYLNIHIILRLLIKLITAGFFIFIMDKLFNVREALKEVLNYGWQK